MVSAILLATTQVVDMTLAIALPLQAHHPISAVC
jgi:hypothetical protein